MAAPRIVLREQVEQHGDQLRELKQGQARLTLDLLEATSRLEGAIYRAGLNGEREVIVALKPLADATPEILEMVDVHRTQTAVAAALVIADKERERLRQKRWGWFLKHLPKFVTLGKVLGVLAALAWIAYFLLQIVGYLTGHPGGTIHS